MVPLLAATLMLALAVPGQAQERVSENRYLRVLQEGHPGVAALGERVGAARGERVRAGLLSNPAIGFEREAPGNIEQDTWQIAWTPPLDGRRGAATRAAEAGLRAASSQFEFDRLMLRSDLRQAFADWAISSERMGVIGFHLALIRRLAEQMEARASRGEESKLGARRLALAALEVEAEAARAEASAARARGAARSLNGTVSRDALPERPPLPNVTDTLAAARPDLLARRYEVEQAEWQLRRGQRFLQFPELAFGWQQIRDDNFTAEGPRFSASWPLPLFDRQQPERVEATAKLAAARGRLDLAKARADAELQASRAAYAQLRQAALQGLETVGQGEQAVESATATFRLGESRLTDLLESLRSILAARLAAIDLYAAALEAHRHLELAVGRPLSPEER
jgi:outer membrane protein TolC